MAVLQGLRCFLSQAKSFLLDSGELSPPLETLVPDNEKGTTILTCKDARREGGRKKEGEEYIIRMGEILSRGRN